MGFRDKSRHLCTLYLEAISLFITENIDPDFGLSRYAEHLGRYAYSFDELNNKLLSESSYIDDIMLEILDKTIQKHKSDFISITIPFPGNLYSALRCGKFIKDKYPDKIIEIGGGFVNTELRSLSDVRVFNYVDFITLDDGELPIQRILEYIDTDCADNNKLVRTFIKKDNKVLFCNDKTQKDIPFNLIGTPDYSNLPLQKYLSVIAVANPMHT